MSLDLCDPLVLEQFKNSLPLEVVSHSWHGEKTASEAATLSDEYVLSHKGKCGDYCASDDNTTAKATGSPGTLESSVLY